ncbi:MAG: trigger factor family protein, partial [Mycoplasmataceae bacterium]|nr:trigger factor family protein [Mycoplasmataceae bacterium]
MKKNVSKKNGILNIDIAFSGDEWKKAVNKSKEELLKNVTVKGFRKGQAPKDIALKQIEPTSIYKNALD